MTDHGASSIVAAVDADQRDAMIAVARQLCSCLSVGTGINWPVQLHVIGRDDLTVPLGMVLVASLIDDVQGDAPISTVETRWRDRIARYRAAGHDRILLCTVFRHVEADAQRPELGERIRRLNLMAITLSRNLGVEIVDIDRFLALFGARTIKSDYRCQSKAAIGLVGHAVTLAILDGELDSRLDGAAQSRSAAAHNNVGGMAGLVESYIKDRRTI